MSKKKIFITGIGGYVGSAVAVFLSKNYDVIGFGHGKNFGVLRKALPKGAKLVSGDITDKEKLLRASRGAYAIIHTASPTTEKYCIEHPSQAAHSIVAGTRVVYEATVKNKVPLFVHFSTQAVYGNFKRRPLPLRENMELAPDTMYGALKAEAECEITGHQSSVIGHQSSVIGHQPNVVIVRPSNIYGYGSGILRNNVAHTFAEKAKNGESLFVKGGEQRVDFIHVRDIAALVKKIIKKPLSRKVVIINAGFGKPIPIKRVADIVAKESVRLFNREPRVVIQKIPRSSLAADRYLSRSQARKLFGWEPIISLEEGIRELLQ